MEKNTTDILRTKAMLNFILPLIPKGGKKAPFIYPALNVPILIRNDDLTSEEFKAKTVCEYSICNARYEYLKKGL